MTNEESKVRAGIVLWERERILAEAKLYGLRNRLRKEGWSA